VYESSINFWILSNVAFAFLSVSPVSEPPEEKEEIVIDGLRKDYEDLKLEIEENIESKKEAESSWGNEKVKLYDTISNLEKRISKLTEEKTPKPSPKVKVVRIEERKVVETIEESYDDYARHFFNQIKQL